MSAEQFWVPLRGAQRVSALIYRPPHVQCDGVACILAHGAGAGQRSAFMTACADGLASRGVEIVTFNFLYAEEGRRVPDPLAKLEACYRAVIDAVRARLPDRRLVIGGKSMGGRVASLLVAKSASGFAGLVLMGYPLHPPADRAKLRSAHFPEISAPTLFVQGSRDPFGSPEELAAVTAVMRMPPRIEVVHGGDHSFKIPSRMGLTQDAVLRSVHAAVAEWLHTL